MATPVSGAPGSVGVVDTQFLDLPAPIKLDCVRSLSPIRVAYETYGTLAPARDNVILVCHALSGDAHAAGIAKTPPAESTRDGFGAEDRDQSTPKGLGGGQLPAWPFYREPGDRVVPHETSGNW